MFRDLVATLLITSPLPFAPESVAWEDCEALVRVSQDLEISGGRYETWLFNQSQDAIALKTSYLNELAILRNRWDDLHDAPAAVDGIRFWLHAHDYHRQMTLSDVYEQHLCGQRAIHGATWDQEFQVRLDELRHLRNVWAKTVEASGPAFLPHTRRYALKELRDLIGHEDYNLGRLPPPMPLHRMKRID